MLTAYPKNTHVRTPWDPKSRTRSKARPDTTKGDARTKLHTKTYQSKGAFTNPFQSFLKFSWLKLGLQKLGGFDVSLKDSKIKRTRKPLNAAAFTGNVLSPSSFRISLILA